jgi:hypothetical protein
MIYLTTSRKAGSRTTRPKTTRPTVNSPQDNSPQDNSPHDISPHRHFAPRTFRPTDILPHGHLAPRTICPTDNSPHGHFAPRTFHPTDNSPHGQLAPWTTRPMKHVHCQKKIPKISVIYQCLKSVFILYMHICETTPIFPLMSKNCVFKIKILHFLPPSHHNFLTVQENIKKIAKGTQKRA